MESSTDTLRLNDTKLFKVIKETVPGDGTETLNIIEIRDNVLYVWNSNDSCILTLNVGAARGKTGDEIVYQTLLLTDPPTYEVTNLQINETTTQLAIWGNCGIAVVELPKRWGKDALFQGGKEVISCRSHSLDERLFHCSVVTEVRRVRWHPASTKDCHLLVLTSQNTFNLYECEPNGGQSLIKTWTVGPAFSSPAKIPSPASLGETAVDFDFATPTLRPEIDRKDTQSKDVDWNDIEWPILVLKGNGNVYTVHGNILNGKGEKPVVTGPLSIYPRTHDNYGVDSCSIMCLQTTPPLVVVATNTGKVYHSILLQEKFEDDEKTSWSQYGSTFSLHTPEDALYVYECVEMELGLGFWDIEKKYSCPVHLHVDRGNSSRYFCSHNAGIHVVNLPMVSQLADFIQAPDDDSNLFLPSLSTQSSSQYLVCTKTKSSLKAAPVLGFGLLQEPCIMIALLHTGTVVSLSVVDLYYLPTPMPLEPVTSPSKKITKEAFDTYIKSLLRHNVSQPILKFGSTTESMPQEVLQLLLRATEVFRSEHFARHNKVRTEIAKRVRTLRALKTHQLKELELLAEQKKKLQEVAERLAERYEDMKDQQEELARRAEEVLWLANQRQPSMSVAEKEEANEFKKISSKTKELIQQLEKLKYKEKYQSEQLANCHKLEANKNIIISTAREDTIKTNLKEISAKISNLMSTVKSLEEEVLS
ncbi:nuclear pore complex protein Nup88 [Neodiprion lecontei]|uniref:Nuclear pore complex protein Nup88 n=1 Tax=Neodiprion lecontei TaxID=441921 RepID=A0ABM3FNW7_NEOLC|nr:nuclear pore complex protein Nup88 [Neodiprion lecontei]